MSEAKETVDKRAPWYWNAASKLIYTVLSIAVVPGITYYFAMREKIDDDKIALNKIEREAYAKKMEDIRERDHLEDLDRLDWRWGGGMNDDLEYFFLQIPVKPTPSKVVQASLSRWLRSNIEAGLEKEDYDLFQVLGEKSNNPNVRYKPTFAYPQNISEKPPGLVDFLHHVYKKERFFVYQNWGGTDTLDRPGVSDEFRDWYFRVPDLVYLIYALGETGDLHERWFFSAKVKRQDYEGFEEEINNIFKVMGNKIKDKNHLDK